MGEDNRSDVQRRDSLHARTRRGDVVAVERARERDPTEPVLQGIADEQESLATGVQAHAAWCVARRVDHPEPAKDGQDVAVRQRHPIFEWRRHGCEEPTPRRVPDRVSESDLKVRGVGWVDEDLDASIGERASATGVIGVAVRADDATHEVDRGAYGRKRARDAIERTRPTSVDERHATGLDDGVCPDADQVDRVDGRR